MKKMDSISLVSFTTDLGLTWCFQQKDYGFLFGKHKMFLY